MNKHVLFISYDGMTDQLGTSQIIPYIIGLTKQGYSFTLLSCDKPDRLLKLRSYITEILSPYPIEWVPILYHKKPPVLSTLYDYWNLKRHAKKLHRKKPFDLVHTRSGVPSLVGLWLKKNLGIKFYNDVRGYYADDRVDGNMWSQKWLIYRMVYRFFKKHELACFLKADVSSVLTYAARRDVQQWKNIPNQPIPLEVIPCSADVDFFNPTNINLSLKEKLREELGIKKDEFIVSYLGSVGGWYMTGEMIHFCKVLYEKKPGTRFLFISPQPHSLILELAAKYGLPEESLILRQGLRHEIPALLSFSSYSLFFIKACYSKIAASPTKHGEIMAMGIPVITNSGVGDVKEIVEKYKGGFVINQLTAEAFNATAEQIAAGYNFDPKLIRKGAIEFYSLDNALAKYTANYNKLFA